ncbi:MAG: PAS domain S-box protein [Burkholderiales bacterium]|nr:PAS domain S-box protein [Burkholderiales bacterium]
MDKANTTQVRRNAGAILLLFFGLTLAAIVAQTWWAIVQDKELTLASERENGLVAVRLLQEHASQTLQDAERKILSVTQAVQSNTDNMAQDEVQLRAFVHDKVLDDGAIKALQFINRDGVAWVTSRDFTPHHNDVSNRPDVKYLLLHPETLDSVIGHPFQSRYDSQWVMPVLRNLFDRQGKWLGLISADVRVSYFGAVYARAAKDNDATAALFANNGFVIVRSPFEARYVNRDISSSAVLQQLADGDAEGSFSHEDFLDDEKARLYTYRKIPGFPITTVYGRDLETILTPWKSRSQDRILFAAAIIALLGMLTFYLSYYVNKLHHNKTRLRESENKFIGLFQQSPLPLALLNVEKDYLIEANHVFLHQFGYEREELVRVPASHQQLWHTNDAHTAYHHLLHKHEVVEKMEVDLQHKDGSRITCLISSRMFSVGGQTMVIFSPLDITNQRLIENEIRDLNQELEQRVRNRTQKLEQTNQELAHTLHSLQDMQKDLIHAEKMAALGSLVTGVAHELNTPLGNSMTMVSSMVTDTQNLLRTMEERTLRRSELETFLSDGLDGANALVTNLARAAELVSSFKQVAVDQASNLARHFELRKVLEEMVLTSAPLYRNLNIKLEMHLQPEIYMYSYPGAVSQALSNFITNALNHGFENRDHGKMTLSCQLINDEEVEVVFTDDGCGIPIAHLGRVFDPFFTTKMGQGSNGLGMHIVYNQVTALLGGEIDIDSEEGVGTTVRMVLPLTAPALRQAQSEKLETVISADG